MKNDLIGYMDIFVQYTHICMARKIKTTYRVYSQKVMFSLGHFIGGSTHSSIKALLMPIIRRKNVYTGNFMFILPYYSENILVKL